MNVQIRPLQENDAYISVKWRNIPKLWVYTEFKADREITIADELNWIRKVTADPTCRRFAILADGRYVGNTYLTGIANHAADFHIFIGDQAYWGKGVAKAASKLVIAYAKDTLGLRTIDLSVKPANTAAFALYHKLGFEETGTKGEFTTMQLDLQSISGTKS